MGWALTRLFLVPCSSYACQKGWGPGTVWDDSLTNRQDSACSLYPAADSEDLPSADIKGSPCEDPSCEMSNRK